MSAWLVPRLIEQRLRRGPAAAALAGNVDQLAHALDVERREGIVLQDAALLILLQERRRIVTAEAKRGLREVVGAEAEELRRLGDFAGAQGGTRQLDHGADEIV